MGVLMGFNDINLWSINRRDFLTLSTSLITAMSLWGMSGIEISHAAEIKFPEGKCGDKKDVQKRVLVT